MSGRFQLPRAATIAVAIALALAALGVMSVATALASPADPNVVKTLPQPNGPDLRVHLWGDEFLHGYETTDGYTIAFDRKDKSWKYAERAANGRLNPSKETAAPRGGPASARNLRPTASAFDAERREQGAPALGAPAAAAPPGWAGSDTDVLFLVVEFTDTGCSFTPAQLQTNMFGGGASGPGDLDDYFDEISYGDLDLVGTVTGNQAGSDCIGLANNRAFYNTDAATADDDNRDDALVREAVNAANSYVNFADYDNDNNGTVDALGIIYAGGGPHDGCATDNSPSGGDGDQLWPHSGAVDTGGALSADGKTIQPFIINSERTYAIGNSSNCNQMQTIGLFAHELGHSMGLPDLYDTDTGAGGGSGVDTWSTMASQYVSTTNNADTPPHYDPWSKAFEGWVTPAVHQPGDRLTPGMSQVETSGEVHQFLNNPDGFQIGGSGEYFLVENRQKTGFDQGLAGCGLIVWHIDEAQTTNQRGGHTADTHRLVDIDEADGEADLDANRGADAGDPFPGSSNNRLFADGTNPNSKLYNGTTSNVRMYVQNPTCGSTMSAAFGPNQAPVAAAGGPYTTDEGTNANLTAAGSSDPDGDPLTYAWDLDNDGEFDDSTSQTPTFTNVGDNGVFTVKVSVSDNFGDSSTASTTVTVNNVKPTVPSLSNDGPKPENTAVSISGLVSDPGWQDTLTATVNWGDGGGAQPLSGALENGRPDATLSFSASHIYGDNGTYTVSVCASDDDGASSSPCATTSVSVSNVDPTASIDESGSVQFNGVPTVITKAGTPLSLTGRSTDPGSDDLTLSWLWADGSPITSTLYLVNPPLADGSPSPSIQPRDVSDTQSHAFTACLYDVGFKAVDDDAGTSLTDTVKVLVTGTAENGRQSGYWAHQYRLNGRGDFDAKTLDCYLQIAAFASRVFNEQRDVSTFALAQRLLFSQGSSVSKLDQLDRDLLTAWLNFANGAVGYAELVDTDGNGTKDTPFHTAVENAEAVRLNPSATLAQLDQQRAIINRINDTI
jgi:M6 family metalloprotease-like protein